MAVSAVGRRGALRLLSAAGSTAGLSAPVRAASSASPSPSASATPTPEPDNIFLRILKGDAPAEVVDEADDLFSFRDRNPASTTHLLVIPRRYIRDASLLTPADAELVRQMERKARALVRAEVGDAFVESELLLGFHMPPWYSVPWLHLHAIYPRHDMSRRYKYTPFSFKSPEWVLGRLAQLR